MKNYLKFLSKLPKNLREKVINAIEKIAANNLDTLDIKTLVGKGKFYRCRIGKIRVIYQKTEQGNSIYDIGFRGNIYD